MEDRNAKVEVLLVNLLSSFCSLGCLFKILSHSLIIDDTAFSIAGGVARIYSFERYAVFFGTLHQMLNYLIYIRKK